MGGDVRLPKWEEKEIAERVLDTDLSLEDIQEILDTDREDVSTRDVVAEYALDGNSHYMRRMDLLQEDMEQMMPLDDDGNLECGRPVQLRFYKEEATNWRYNDVLQKYVPVAEVYHPETGEGLVRYEGKPFYSEE